MNSVILMGTKIGSNVVVGAGSVVSGVIPDNCVVAGNPARVIRSLDEHYRLRRERSFREAKIYVKTFVQAYGRDPSIRECGPFFPMFLERSLEAIEAAGVNMNLNGDVREEILEDFLHSAPIFDSFEDFLAEMKRD